MHRTRSGPFPYHDAVAGVLSGFVIIGIVLGAGWLLAVLRIVDDTARRALANVSFLVATPALLVTMLADADLSTLLSHHLSVSLASVAATSVIYLAVARWVMGRRGTDLVIGVFGSSYVNAANLGLPIAAYALGDVTAVVPMLLAQVLFLQPVGLTVLDVAIARQQGRSLPWDAIVLRPLRNPLTVGALLGVGLNLVGISLPALLHEPLTMVGNMAVPTNLIAFGISLATFARPGSGDRQVWLVVLLKLFAQPAVGWFLAAVVWKLDPAGVLAVTVIAGLPTAQNVFVIASHYDRGVTLARDAIFFTTIGSIATLLLAAALLA